ncbi:MAG TPA: TonB-dependent receptor [Steroidobacteraceae bacterium]
MSRKSRRNVSSNNASKAEQSPAALRLPYMSLGLSSLALGSMAIAGAVHAQDAAASKGASTDTKAKPAPSTQAAKSLRTKVTRLAASSALPADGAGLIAQAAPAGSAAQDTNLPAPTNSAGTLQEIVVTGIRASLQRALQIKKLSVGVVDAISAEDIGQFPDASVGEAIGRIPGITVNRGSVNQMAGGGAPTATGNVTGITVRGFGTQFNEVLESGRTIASGNGQNFDFSAIGANYLGEIDVLKTPDMSLSSGAIGATINIKFPNPFDHPGLHAQTFVQESDHDLDGGMRPSFGGLLSDTFADGKFGILIDADYSDDHILGHHQDIVGWKGTHLPCSSFANPAACTPDSTGASVNPQWFPQDMAMYLERTDSRRKDGRVAFEWRPSDAVLVTIDDNYSSDNEHMDRWQRSTWFGAFPNATVDSNGTITNFNYTGPTDFNAFVTNIYFVTNTPGINVQWDMSDDWSAEFDADQSVSKLNPNGGLSQIDADTGYGNTLNNYTGGLALNSNGNVLPYWTGYGPGAVASGSSAVASPNANGLNPFIVGSHVIVNGIQENTDKINEVKLDATWHKDSTKVNFGAQFEDDTWNSHSMDTLQNNYWQLWSGYGPASGNKSGQALPSSFFTAVNLGTWMPGYSGGGNLPGSLLEYNPYTVVNYLLGKPINAGFKASSGYPAYTGGFPQPGLNYGTVQHVDRQNYSPFVTAEQNVPLGDMTLKVDLGLRYQKTKVDIFGLGATVQSVAWSGPGDATAYQINLTTPAKTTSNNSYGYFLPALDLNLMVTPDLKVRADFSRTETPSVNSQLIPGITYSGRVNALSATGQNPKLLPYLADNFDLGAEWYYAENDYVSLDGFLKHVTQFPVSSITPVEFPNILDPAPAINPLTGGPLSNTSGKPMVFQESTIVNGLSANVTGLEATWQQMLMYGFGLQINGTYAHSNRNFNATTYTSNQFALPGVGNSANLIAFYQAHGLQARIALQWQGSQLLTLGQEQSGGAFGNEPVYLASSTNLDFSSTYDLTSNVSVYFEALNLTDSVYHTYGRFKNQTLNLVDFGRSYTLGVRAKF